MAQNKASLEKTLQASFRNKRAGTEIATSILGIEAMIASGIETNAIVENTDKKLLGQIRAGCAHKSYGKRLADSITTLDAIIAHEALVETAEDKHISGLPHGEASPYKDQLRKVMIGSMGRRDVGLMVSDIVDLSEKVIDDLIGIYGPSGAKEIVGVNEIQHVAFGTVPDAGNFKLVFSGQTTANIAFNANAAAVKAALEALSNIDLVTVTGSFAAGFDVTFQGSLAETNVAAMTTSANTLTTTATPVVITITTPTAGVTGNAIINTNLTAIKAVLNS